MEIIEWRWWYELIGWEVNCMIRWLLRENKSATHAIYLSSMKRWTAKQFLESSRSTMNECEWKNARKCGWERAKIVSAFAQIICCKRNIIAANASMLVYSQKIHHHYPLFLLLFRYVGTKTSCFMLVLNNALPMRVADDGLRIKRVKECTHVYASCEESVSVNSRAWWKYSSIRRRFQSRHFLYYMKRHIHQSAFKDFFCFLKNNKLEL